MTAWTPKESRTITVLVNSLFSPKAFIAKPTKEYFQDFRNLPGMINVNGKQCFLAPSNRNTYTRLTDILLEKNELSNFFTRSEIFQQISQSHKDILTNVESSNSFLDHVVRKLNAKKKIYKFLVPIDGIILTDIDQIKIGNITFCREDKSILSEIQFKNGDEENYIYDKIKNDYWVIGEAHGGPEFARDLFEQSTKIAIGILAIYGVILYKRAFWNTRIKAKLTAYDSRSSAHSLCWVKGDGQLSTRISYGDHQSLVLSSNILSDLPPEIFLDKIAVLNSTQVKSELQNALRTAILWFHDAYQDQNNTMKFIKLWSCAECFFSSDRNHITQDNSTGIACILAFAGFNIIANNEYTQTKIKIKKLYDLRSKSVHDADLNNITLKDLRILSTWIAWLILTLFALSEHGYTTIKQVKEKIDQIDTISKAT